VFQGGAGKGLTVPPLFSVKKPATDTPKSDSGFLTRWVDCSDKLDEISTKPDFYMNPSSIDVLSFSSAPRPAVHDPVDRVLCHHRQDDETRDGRPSALPGVDDARHRGADLGPAAVDGPGVRQQDRTDIRPAGLIAQSVRDRRNPLLRRGAREYADR